MKSVTRFDVGLLILRLGLGLVFFYYGGQKALGLFGGPGYAITVENFGKGGFPPLWANLAIAGEFLGGLGVLVGLLTPVAAFGIVCTMSVAVYKHATEPDMFRLLFSAGDPAAASKLLFPSALLVLALAVLVMGAGRLSIDARLFRRKGK